MANHASHAALPYPIKGARFTVLIPYLDADGDPVDPTTPDTEISKDDGAAADTTEEVASPKNSVGMLTLTGAELDCSCASVAAKAASGPKTTLITLYPRVLAVVSSGTSLSAGSASGGTLVTPLAYDITGCFFKTTGGTGGGGTGGANNQVRKIVTYNVSTGAFTVSPNFETAISTDTDYDILLPEGVTIGMLKTLRPLVDGRKLDVDLESRAMVRDSIAYGGVSSVTSQTELTVDIGGAVAWTTNGLNNALALIIGTTSGIPDGQVSIRKITDSADSGSGSLNITLESAPDFTVAIGDTVYVLSGVGSLEGVLDQDALDSIADNVLKRSVATVEASAPEHCVASIVLAILEWSISGTTWTIKRSDGSTVHFTRTLTSVADPEGVTSVN